MCMLIIKTYTTKDCFMHLMKSANVFLTCFPYKFSGLVALNIPLYISFFTSDMNDFVFSLKQSKAH